jgi:hypothetical protein
MAWSTPPNWTNLQVVSESDMDTYVTGNTQHLYDIIHGVVSEALTILGDTTFRDDGAINVTIQRNSTDVTGSEQIFQKSRGTNASKTVVVADDELGIIRFRGYDGASFVHGAAIQGAVDGSPGSGDMPGRLSFFTTPDASVSPSERLRISAAGQVLIKGIGPLMFENNGSASGVNICNDSDLDTGINFATDVVQLMAAGTHAFAVEASGATGGASFFGTGSYGGGSGVIFIANRTSAPASNPAGGGILYAESGALKWRGSSGTVTTVAAA